MRVIMHFQNLFVVLCACFVTTNCTCTTTFISTCTKISDVERYGQKPWKNLIIANDPCSEENVQLPTETLNQGAFGETPNLEELYISGMLQRIESKAFDGLYQLTYLKLHKNLLTVIPRGTFSNLPQVNKMDLSENSIENIQHFLFENSSITWINLSHNKINNIQVDQLNIPSLRKLTITHNHLSLLVPNCFHKNIKYLDFDNNKLSGIAPEILTPLTNLEVLILSNNLIKGLSDKYPLPKLLKLDLSHNAIESIDDGSFAKMPELKHLYLGDNLMVYFSPNLFDSRNRLETLHLHRNVLLFLDTAVGERLAYLKEISLGANPWSCHCLAEIIVYITAKNISQPQCEKPYFSKGESPICTQVDDEKCTGNEKITQELYERFRQSLRYYSC